MLQGCTSLRAPMHMVNGPRGEVSQPSMTTDSNCYKLISSIYLWLSFAITWPSIFFTDPYFPKNKSFSLPNKSFFFKFDQLYIKEY